MTREIGKLTAAKVDQLKKLTGMHADGGGLYLQVKNGGASWVLRYQFSGRARYMGLGPLSLFGLKEARGKALDARRLNYEGADPVEARRQARAKLRLDAAKSMTFSEAADRYIGSHKAGWRNAKHATQWTNTLNTYAGPIIGAIPVQAVDTAMVLKIVEPLWTTKPETAGRLRGRVESILDWATARGFRAGENPARWRGHLDKILPAGGKVRSVKHHAALPYGDLPDFVTALASQDGVAARALEFAILTAARTGEVLGATWGEIDLASRVWTVPAERMKGKRKHTVPLSTRAVAILAELKPEKAPPGAFVFPGAKAGKPLSNMSMLMTLRRMGRDDLTAHGFRSTFRDWVAERTNFSSEVAEMALAHSVGNKVEAAYRRGDMFERRRRMMDEWAMFCETPAQPAQGSVVKLRPSA